MEQVYAGKKVAIVGYGLEGVSAAEYFFDQGAHVTVFDEKLTQEDVPSRYTAVLGIHEQYDLNGYDIVSRSPSIRPSRIITDGEKTSLTIEFFKNCPAPIIAVTGTKGKGTTSSLIAEILKKAGKTTHLVGNIGTPALDVIRDITPEDYVVYEISSFQLWDMYISPHIAVVLMMGVDHQDIHTSMDEYVKAKQNIASHQSVKDVVIFHPTNQMSAKVATVGMGKKLKYLTDEAAFIRGNDIVLGEHKICSIDEVGLIGAHNLENVAAAISAAWSCTQDIAAIRDAVMSFKGLPHRIEFVKTVEDVKYYNDSYSSAIDATVAALRAVAEPKVLILGGKDKKGSIFALCDMIKTVKIRKILLIGETKDRYALSLNEVGVHNYILVDGGMSDIVTKAKSYAEAGDAVLLSPGTSSYDMFKNFKDRGEQFVQCVNGL